MKGISAIFIAVALTVARAEDQCPVDQETNWEIEKLLRHEDCHKFYKCTLGTPIEYTCPSNLYFNLDIWQCDWPANVDCEGRNDPADTTTTSTTTPAPTTSTTTLAPTTTTTTLAPTTTTTTLAPTTTTTTLAPTTTTTTAIPTTTTTTTPVPTTTTTTTTPAPTTTTTTTTPAPTTTTTTTTPAPTTTTTTTTPAPTTTTTTTTPAPTTTTTTTTPAPTTTTTSTTTTTPAPTTTTTTPTTTTTTTTTTPVPTTTSSTTTTTTPLPDCDENSDPEPEEEEIDMECFENGCPVDPHIHWLLPHETDCNLFYYCVRGEKVLRQCPGSLHFNRVIQVCDWPHDAGCAISANKHLNFRHLLAHNFL